MIFTIYRYLKEATKYYEINSKYTLKQLQNLEYQEELEKLKKTIKDDFQILIYEENCVYWLKDFKVEDHEYVNIGITVLKSEYMTGHYAPKLHFVFTEEFEEIKKSHDVLIQSVIEHIPPIAAEYKLDLIIKGPGYRKRFRGLWPINHLNIGDTPCYMCVYDTSEDLTIPPTRPAVRVIEY